MDGSHLSGRDRGLVTELVYGVTRMRRALDAALDPHLRRPVDDDVRTVLRLGAYQVLMMGVPPHAAVSTAVDVAPPRARGLVNAVLRKVATTPADWSDAATRLSYPDWIVERLDADLGADLARDALERMNQPPPVTVREDGVVQDLASQDVVAYVGAEPGERVADLCAGPGGKTTGMAAAGPKLVMASDSNVTRAGLVRANALRLEQTNVAVVVADAAARMPGGGSTPTHPSAWVLFSAASSHRRPSWCGRGAGSSTACALSPGRRRRPWTPGRSRSWTDSALLRSHQRRGGRGGGVRCCSRRTPTPTGCTCSGWRERAGNVHLVLVNPWR